MKNILKTTVFITVIAIFYGCGENTTSKTEHTNDSVNEVIEENNNNQPVENLEKTENIEEIEKEFTISWRFEQYGETEYLAPITKMIMNINGKDTVLLDYYEFSGNEITDDGEYFALYKMPENTLSAFWSWYGGGGYYYYVIQEQDKLVVMRALTDESLSHDDLVYEIFKEIPVSEFK